MAHVASDPKKILTRVRRIRGQVNALETALENQPDCYAVLQQIAAIRGAVNGLMTEVLESHLREHLAGDGLSQNERDAALNEVTAILKSYLK